MRPFHSAISARDTNRFRSRSSLASAAALAAVAAPSLLQAQIIWSGTLNSTVNSGTPTSTLDFNSSGALDENEAQLHWASGGAGGANTFLESPHISKSDDGIGLLYQDTPVSFGSTIDGNLTGYDFQHPVLTNDGTAHFYAFEYQVSGSIHYGWAEITVATDNLSAVLNQWAYNNVAGSPITAGQTSAIPEPTAAVTCFGLAAFGAVWWRKRLRRARFA